MRQSLPALLLLCLGVGTTAAFVWSSLDTTEAQAGKQRKAPRRPRTKHQSSGHGAGTGSRGAPGHPKRELPPIQRTKRYAACPAEMVNVRGQFCIDRWEASTVDVDTGQTLSPYYPPEPRLAGLMHQQWQREVTSELAQARSLMLEAGVIPPRDFGAPDADPASWLDESESPPTLVRLGAPRRRVVPDASVETVADSSAPLLVPSPQAPYGFVLIGDAGADARPRAVVLLPGLASCQVGRTFRAKAVSAPNVVPQGYSTGIVAEQACRASGKRLCREQEWVLACKGERATKHPYGDSYQRGKCNVFREEHPGRALHGDWSNGLSDPRLNLVAPDGEPLLHSTGETSTCKSQWGNDAIFDMVGNIDEWVDDPGGVFVGGFYARNTRNGCEARVGAHPTVYFDYSLGFRCCADLVGGP
jgi:hypothetical protein